MGVRRSAWSRRTAARIRVGLASTRCAQDFVSEARCCRAVDRELLEPARRTPRSSVRARPAQPRSSRRAVASSRRRAAARMAWLALVSASLALVWSRSALVCSRWASARSARSRSTRLRSSPVEVSSSVRRAAASLRATTASSRAVSAVSTAAVAVARRLASCSSARFAAGGRRSEAWSAAADAPARSPAARSGCCSGCCCRPVGDDGQVAGREWARNRCAATVRSTGRSSAARPPRRRRPRPAGCRRARPGSPG